MRTMLVGRDAERHAGDDDTRWPALRIRQEGNRAARLTMSSWSCGVFGHHAMHSPHTTICALYEFGVIATTGGFGRSRATRIASTRRGPADDRRQFPAFGDLPRASAMASPTYSPARAAAPSAPGVGRIAFHFLADAVHVETASTEFAGGRFSRRMMASAPS